MYTKPNSHLWKSLLNPMRPCQVDLRLWSLVNQQPFLYCSNVRAFFFCRHASCWHCHSSQQGTERLERRMGLLNHFDTESLVSAPFLGGSEPFLSCYIIDGYCRPALELNMHITLLWRFSFKISISWQAGLKCSCVLFLDSRSLMMVWLGGKRFDRSGVQVLLMHLELTVYGSTSIFGCTIGTYAPTRLWQPFCLPYTSIVTYTHCFVICGVTCSIWSQSCLGSLLASVQLDI